LGRWHARGRAAIVLRYPAIREKPSMQSGQSAARHNEHCVVVAPIERVSALRARSAAHSPLALEADRVSYYALSSMHIDLIAFACELPGNARVERS